jgi:glycosyltransferase involved in cell wall biosynthesis
LFVGRLVAKKGVPVLLHAFDLANRDIAGLRLLIVGDDSNDLAKPNNGPVEAELRVIARALEVACNWVGGLSDRMDVRRYYWSADCLVLPSRNEGCSNTLLEAMSCGLPCVVSQIRANTDLLGAMDVGSFALDDAEGLAGCIRPLMVSSAHRLAVGEYARKWATSHFDIREIVTVYERTYREMLGGR